MHRSAPRAADRPRLVGAALCGFLLLVLVAATVVVSNARFQFPGEDLLVNPGFAEGLVAWQTRGVGRVRVEPARPAVAQLSKAPGPGIAALGQEFAPSRSASHILVTAEMRTMDVAQGQKSWNTGRIVAAPLSVQGVFIPGRPHVLVSQAGDNGWSRHEGIFPLAPDVATVKIELQLLETSGTVEIRNLSVRQAVEAGSVARLHRWVGACWLVVIGGFLFWVWRRLPTRGVVVCGALLVTTLILAAPRPQDHVIRPMLTKSFIDASAITALFPALSVEDRAATTKPATAPQAKTLTPDQPASAPRTVVPAWVQDGWSRVVQTVRQFDHLDEYMHTTLLFALTLFCLAVVGAPKQALVSGAVIAISVVSEFLQVFSLGRTFSLSDLGFNLLGVAGGMALYILACRATELSRLARPG